MIFNCPLSPNFPHIKLLFPCQMSSFLTHPSPFSCLHLRNPKITSPILEQFKLHKLFCLLPFQFFSFYIGSHNNYQLKPVIDLFIYRPLSETPLHLLKSVQLLQTPLFKYTCPSIPLSIYFPWKTFILAGSIYSLSNTRLECVLQPRNFPVL